MSESDALFIRLKSDAHKCKIMSESDAHKCKKYHTVNTSVVSIVLMYFT